MFKTALGYFFLQLAVVGLVTNILVLVTLIRLIQKSDKHFIHLTSVFVVINDIISFLFDLCFFSPSVISSVRLKNVNQRKSDGRECELISRTTSSRIVSTRHSSSWLQVWTSSRGTWPTFFCSWWLSIGWLLSFSTTKTCSQKQKSMPTCSFPQFSQSERYCLMFLFSLVVCKFQLRESSGYTNLFQDTFWTINDSGTLYLSLRSIERSTTPFTLLSKLHSF